MTLDEALHYIHSVCWKGSVPGLERISALLDKMGHPERRLKFIHVTGTNGKGSTCAMLASMFTKAGYKTGLYTSPYLIRFNERIQIDGVQIPDEEICEITEYIKPLADSIFEQPTELKWSRRWDLSILPVTTATSLSVRSAWAANLTPQM